MVTLESVVGIQGAAINPLRDGFPMITDYSLSGVFVKCGARVDRRELSIMHSTSS